MRAPLAAVAIALALPSTGCPVRHAPPAAKAIGTIAVSITHTGQDGAGVDAPDEYREALRTELARVGLQLRSLTRFGDVAATDAAKLRDLAARSGDVDFVATIDSKATFYSEIEGRFRWTVTANLVIARPGRLGEARRDKITTHAMLLFPHEGAREALRNAGPPLARRVAAAVASFADQSSASAARGRPIRTVPRAESLYFVMVDRFFNGDPSNDGAIQPSDPNGWHGGDLAGILAKLDYISDLGVSAIWMSPITASRAQKVGGHGAFHGYWVRDHNRIEPRFGSEAALVKLREAAAERGISLVLDTVVNHVGYDAPLFKSKPGWFHHNGDVKDWNDARQLTDFDVHGLPDLAQEKAPVYRYLLESTRKWVESARPSGLRLDAVRHVPATFWKRFNRDVKSMPGAPTLVGEVFDGNPAVLADALRVQGFDRVFDFPLYYAMADVFCRDHSLEKLATTLSLDRLYEDASKLVTFADNHDLPRLASLCKGDDEQKALLQFLLSARGSPSITYGTEVGLLGAKEPDNRADMRFSRGWRYQLIASMLAARAKYPSMTRGRFVPIAVEDELFAYARVLGNEATVVAVTRALPRTRRLRGPTWLRGSIVFTTVEAEVPMPTGQVYRLGDNGTVVFVVRAEHDLAVPAPASATLTVRIVPPSASLRVGGSGPELGHWDKGAALSFDRRGEARAQLEVGTTVAVKLLDTKTGRWQPGENHFVHISGDTEVELTWRK